MTDAADLGRHGDWFDFKLREVNSTWSINTSRGRCGTMPVSMPSRTCCP
jgi:hypothetical protein